MATSRRWPRISGRPVIYNVLGAVDRAPTAHLDTIAWLERLPRARASASTAQARHVRLRVHVHARGLQPLRRRRRVARDAPRHARGAAAPRSPIPARREALKARLPFAGTGPIEGVVVIRAHADETKHFENHTVADVGRIHGQALRRRVPRHRRGRRPAHHLLRRHDDATRSNRCATSSTTGGRSPACPTAARTPSSRRRAATRPSSSPASCASTSCCDLEEAHWRLAALPAMCAGFRDRGTIVEGGAGRRDRLRLRRARDRAETEIVHDLPGGDWRRVQRATGYRYVVVNGEITIEDDKETGAPSGRLLRHGAA